MNLYEFSQANNNEMGIHITKKDDLELYNATFEEAQRLLTISEEIRITVRKVTTETPSKTETKKVETLSTKSKSTKPTGFCIRTGVVIPFNIEKPMSYDAFKAWSKYSDLDYPEKFCHFSGEPSNGETSVSKPILHKNWKKANDYFS